MSCAKIIELQTSLGLRVLLPEINELVAKATTPFSLSPSQSFPSLKSAVIYLRAAAAEGSVCLYMKFSTVNYKIICSRGRPGRGSCKMSWTLKRSEESVSRWKIEVSNLGHNHEISPVKVYTNVEIVEEIEEEEKEVEVVEVEEVVVEEGAEEESEAESDFEILEKVKVPVKNFIPKKSTKATKLTFVALGNIRPEIEKLIAGDPLPCPSSSSTISFPSHNAFRLYTLASAEQAGYNLYLSSTAHTSDFQLKCRNNHARFPSHSRCSYFMLIVQSEKDQRWRVGEVTEHNSICEKTRKALASESSSEGEEEEEKEEVASSSSSSRGHGISPPPESCRPSSSGVSKIFDKESISISSQPSLKRHKPTPPSINPSLSRSPSLSIIVQPRRKRSIRSISVKELRYFLDSISPALLVFANHLHSNGLNTQIALVNLLSMTPEGIDLFLDHLDKKGGIDKMKHIQRIIFKAKIIEIRSSRKS